MTDTSDLLPEDPHELYRLLLRGASTVWQLEAAEILVFKVKTLRDWLIRNHFIKKCNDQIRPYASTDFRAALDRADELPRDEDASNASWLGVSERAVLCVASSLSGQVQVGTLRQVMTDLEEEHAQFVAEAMMYAAGFMDATADPDGNEPGPPGSGPNAIAHERRILGKD